MTPYGYKIENNQIVKASEDAARLYAFFKFYAEGRSVTEAREAASLPVGTTTAKQILRRSLYTGTEGYPAIIPAELWSEVQNELARRTHAPTRKKEPPIPVCTTFRLGAFPIHTAPGDMTAAIEQLYTSIVADRAGHMTMTREEKRQVQTYLASQSSISRRRVS